MHAFRYPQLNLRPHRSTRVALRTLCLFLLTGISLQAQLPAGTTDASSPTQARPDPQRTQADEALVRRDYAAALNLLTALAEKNPTDAHLLYDLASTQDALDQNLE